MPGMHGWETLAALKEQTNTKDYCDHPQRFIARCEEISQPEVSDWIVKPPDERLLFQALGGH